MITDKEQEAFSLVVEYHKIGASENDIRYAFQRFMEAACVTTASEMSTEAPPGIGNPGSMDLFFQSTCIELKTNVVLVLQRRLTKKDAEHLSNAPCPRT